MRSPGAVGPAYRWVLHVLLLTLLLLGAEAAAEAPGEQQQGWRLQLPLESQVSVGMDGIVRSSGAGRARSDGLSITRSTPYETDMQSDLPVDDQAIRFSPAHMDLGRVDTCILHTFYVRVENRGDVAVRLEAADFTRDGFSLDHDVRGIWMDPNDHFDLKMSLLLGEPAQHGIETDLRLFTTSGLFILPIRSPQVSLNRYGVQGIRASVPVGVRFEQLLAFSNPHDHSVRLSEVYALDSFVTLSLHNKTQWIGPRWPRPSDKNDSYDAPGVYDTDKEYARRADRGGWDMTPGTTNPLATLMFASYTPGQFFTRIHVASGDLRLLLVPVRLTVLKPGIHLEPKVLDMGMLTVHEEPRELFFAVHNAGRNPIKLLELKVLETNVLVSAQLRGSTVIPPLSRVPEALAVQVRVNVGMLLDEDECYASLLLKTNASSTELGQRRLRLYGRVVNGRVAFRLNETLVGVVMPMTSIFNTGDIGRQRGREHDEEEEAGGIEHADRLPSTQLVSLIGGDSMAGMMAGTREFRKLRLWNEFDQPVELQHVWIPLPGPSGEEQQQEVSVYTFKPGVAPPGAAWPDISLQVTPSIYETRDVLASRSYSIMVETNVTVHRVYFHLYLGILDVTSNSGLQNHSRSGYYLHPRASTKTAKIPTPTCIAVPEDGFVPATKPRIDGGDSTMDTQGVQVCRSLLFNLGKVASQRKRVEVVEVTNVNPLSITLQVVSVAANDILDMIITADISVAQEVPMAVAVLGSLDNISGSSGGETHHDWSESKYSKSKSTTVSAGDGFVLPPGHRITFRVELLVKDTLGAFTVPVVTLETPAEVIHLFARFRGVHGTIEPVTPTIVLPPMFPGRTEIVHLQYRNTFAHSVTLLTATLGSPALQLLSMSDVVRPQQVESVLDLLVSPAADAKCSEALFLADCLLPPRSSAPQSVDQTCEQLSGFGEFVDERDLAALSRRDAFWREAHNDKNHSKVEAQVHLQTDIMDDVGAVTITAQMERPLVTASSPTTATTMPGKSVADLFQRREFMLTKVMNRSQLVVSVRNPSNISVQMELAITAADRALFYSCDDEMDLGDWGHDVGEEIPAVAAAGGPAMLKLCLEEWDAIVTDTTTGDRELLFDEVIPPFFFQRKIVRVPPGQEAQLGPIYYLPSQVEEVSTTVFVRNELSHIEPVPLLARSGKGALELTVDVSHEEDGSSSSAHYVAQPSSDFTERTKRPGSNQVKYDGQLSFSLGERDDAKDFTSDALIQLSNTGAFALIIHRVLLENDLNTTSTASSGFRLVSKLLEHEDGNGSERLTSRSDTAVLPAGETAQLRVSFRASCYIGSVKSWLVIDTSDGMKRLRLEGSISPDAAFECRRARMPALVSHVLHAAWMGSAVTAVCCVVYTLFRLVQDAWIGITPVEKQPKYASIDASSDLDSGSHCTSSTADNSSEGGETASSQADAWIDHLLRDLERSSTGPLARVVTPAVTQLLERRQRGLAPATRNGTLHPKAVGNGEGATGQLEGEDKGPEVPVTATPSDEQKRVGGAVESSPTMQRCQKPAANEQTERSEEVPHAAVTMRIEDNQTARVDGAARITAAASTLLNRPKLVLSPGKSPTAVSGTLLRSDDVSVGGGQVAGDQDSIQDVEESEEDQPEDPEELQSSAPSSSSTAVSMGSEESRDATDLPKPLRELLNDHPKVLPLSAPSIPTQSTAATSLPRKTEEPFDAFESMSARWRAENWNTTADDQAPFPALTDLRSDERWGGALSFVSVASDPGELVNDKLHESIVDPGVIHRGSHSFIEGRGGTGPYFDDFSMFGPAPAPSSATTGAKKAPPGFTPADAAPMETRAAFQRLRGDPLLTTTERSSVSSSSSPFASRLSLFGSTLPPSTEVSSISGAGRIGSGRPRHARSASTSTGQHGDARAGLAALGGLELSSPLSSSSD